MRMRASKSLPICGSGVPFRPRMVILAGIQGCRPGSITRSFRVPSGLNTGYFDPGVGIREYLDICHNHRIALGSAEFDLVVADREYHVPEAPVGIGAKLRYG